MSRQCHHRWEVCTGLRRGILTLILVCLTPALAPAQTYAPGQAYFGRSNYIEYVAGDLPVIFSAPHGGDLVPAEIPNRVNDGTDPHFATATDSRTEETAFAVQGAFGAYFGHLPHIIVCQLKRTKVDCNRELSGAVYHTNIYATIAWHEFQNWINVASNSAVAQNGLGFYVDLHGQGHPIKRLELGYLLKAPDLTNSDAALDLGDFATQSSIRTLAGRLRRQFNQPFSQILRGTNSFGALMAAQGFPSVPDPIMPNPGDGDDPITYPGVKNLYFDGGYNTTVHTSRTGGGPVDGLQIEANFIGVRDTPLNRTNYGFALARTLDYFFKNYYGMDLRLSTPCIWNGGTGEWATAANWRTGVTPVSGNYLLFSGPGGSVSNNLSALTSGTGVVHSLIFGTNATGSYTLCGNPIGVQAGVTNLSACPQILSNSLTLLSAQSFAATGPLMFDGPLVNNGFGLTIDTHADVVVNNSISGAGGLNQAGNGTLTLNAASTYTGDTQIQAGRLLVKNADGSANGSGALLISSSATLAGNGMVSGPVTVNGALAPGGPIGPLTIRNGLTLTGNGIYRWNLAKTSTNAPGVDFDQVVLSGGNLALQPNSTLAIHFADPSLAPATNSVFWQAPHSWKIIALTGTAANPGQTPFNAISNQTFAAGKFFSTVDGRGNVFLNFFPALPPGFTAFRRSDHPATP